MVTNKANVDSIRRTSELLWGQRWFMSLCTEPPGLQAASGAAELVGSFVFLPAPAMAVTTLVANPKRIFRES